MGVTFTKEQQQVIDSRGKNLLVSAAAGSGKTAVLVERIIRLVTDPEHPLDIDHLLVVTFTNAAAAEMRERIGAAIERELSSHPGNVHLQRQQTLLHNAQITTIHSFCLFVIRNYFHRIGLEPDARVGDEGELKLMRQDVLKDLLEEYYQKEDPEFLRLSETLATGKSDEKLKEAVLELYEFAMSDPWPKEWLNNCRKPYSCTPEEFCKLPMYRAHVSYLKAVTGQWAQMMEWCLEICREPDGPFMYEELLSQELEMHQGLLGLDSYEEYEKAVSGLVFGRLPAARKFQGDPDKKQQVQNLRKEIKDSRKKLMEQFFFLPPKEMIRMQQENEPVIDMLVQVTLDFQAAYEKKKQEQNLMDFNDLEHFALDILVEEETRTPSSVAKELSEQFAEIMIDEYQDSNYVQETILRAVARDENRFMVGDVKQSIYRFRMARPELFMEKYNVYQEEGERDCKIDLHKNFRSRREVLRVVNDVFSGIMARDLGNVEYDSQAALYQGMEFVKPPKEHMFETEILLADRDDFQEAEEPEDGEFVMIAQKIQRLRKEQMVTEGDSKTLRPLEYQDIVILLRSMGGYGQRLIQVLRDHGIPAAASSGTGYFSAVEVKTVLNVLRLIDNPRQDIPLAAVLTSPIVGLTEGDLADIRIQYPEVSFYKSVCSYAEEGEKEALRERLDIFLQQLLHFRQRAEDTVIHELLYQVLDETGYLDYVYALPGGSVRRANLEMLMERAVAFEKTSYQGLFSFIRYMGQLEKYQVDYGEAEGDESEGHVRIMTIHKSKGLEFPVVFVAGLGRQLNQQDVRSRMVLHPQFGIGLDITDLKRRVRIPSLTRQILARQIQMENAGEELRVLYVALTRAREKLILTGAMKKAGEKLLSYQSQRLDGQGHMGFLFRLKAACYFDWILPVLLQKPGYQVGIASPQELSYHQAQEHIGQSWGREMILTLSREPQPKLAQEIESRLSYEYPFKEEQDLKSKLSVSELKHRAIEKLRQEEPDMEYLFQEPEIIPYVPEFMRKLGEEPPEHTAALRGSAMHRVLECFDFTREFDTLEEQIAGMQENGMLREEMAERISLPGLKQFFHSSLAKRMQQAARAGKLYREKPFVMGKPGGETSKEAPHSRVMVLIQGIIDAFFEEEGELVLVDYKTDAVKREQELARRYQAQMDLYQEALGRATGKQVKEKLLYSFKLRKTILV